MTPPLLGEPCAGIGTGIKSAAVAERGRRGRQVETPKWRHTLAVCACEGPPYDGVGVGFSFSFFSGVCFVFIEPSLNFPRACSVLCLYFESFRMQEKDQNNNNPKTTERVWTVSWVRVGLLTQSETESWSVAVRDMMQK